MELIELLQKNKLFRHSMYLAKRPRNRFMIDRMQSFLKKNDRILDIGSGTCCIADVLLKKGYKVTLLDVKNLSFVDGLGPVLYDGKKIPFGGNKFDVALLVTVLHHVPHPEGLIKEAKRVSKRIIIIEDLFINKFHKYLTFFLDSFLNLQFTGHPHSNKNDGQWKKTFKKLGLKLVGAKYGWRLIFFKHGTYFLEK